MFIPERRFSYRNEDFHTGTKIFIPERCNRSLQKIIIIMNKTAKHLKIGSSKLMNSLFLGNFKAAFHGKWIEFRDFREYNYWDDAKHIDWLRSSTEWSTIMRRYREEKEWKILCVLDIRESLSYSDGVVKKQLMQDIVSLLWGATLASWESFWWYHVSESGVSIVRPRKNKSSILELQNIPDNWRNISQALDVKFLLQKSLKRSVVFIISDARNCDIVSLRAAAQKHDILYVHISSHFENTLESSWVQYLQSGEFGVAVDSANTKKRQEYMRERKKIIYNYCNICALYWNF